MSRSMQQGLLHSDAWQLGLHIGFARAEAARRSLGDHEADTVLEARTWSMQALWATVLQILGEPSSSRSAKVQTTAMASYTSHAWRLALLQLSRMLHLGLLLDRLTYGVAVATCRRQLLWRQCLVCAGEARERLAGECLTSVYNGAMVSCSEAGEQRRLPGIFSEMKMLQVELDVISVNTCISACEKLNRWTESLQFLGATCSGLPAPDSATRLGSSLETQRVDLLTSAQHVLLRFAEVCRHNHQLRAKQSLAPGPAVVAASAAAKQPPN